MRVASIARVGENERAGGVVIFARWANERPLPFFLEVMSVG